MGASRSTFHAATAVAVAVSLAACSSGQLTGFSTTTPVTLGVAAAASLTDVFTELANEFQKRWPEVTIRLDSAASTTLAYQLPHRTDVDIFASANRHAMNVARKNGSVTHSLDVARNRVTLAVPAGNPADVTGLGDLSRPDLRVVLCEPSIPCGQAAQDVLSAAGVAPVVDNYATDARAVLAALTTGEADLAVVYVTDVRSAHNDVEEIPVGPVYRELLMQYGTTEVQVAPVLTGSDSQSDETQEFVDFVHSETARRIFRNAGFPRE